MKPRGPCARNAAIYADTLYAANQYGDVFTKADIESRVKHKNKPVFNHAFKRMIETGIIDCIGSESKGGRGRPTNIYYRVQP